MAQKKSFEEAIKRLEEIVKALESGDTPLEQKVVMLTSDEAGGMEERPFVSEAG